MQETIPGTRAMAQRLVNGEREFVSLIMDSGFTEADAEKIFAIWRKLRCCKREKSGSFRWTVTHGGYWDRDAMERALTLANGGSIG